MSVELREMRRRIAGTRHIRQVTSALQKVAAARLARNRELIALSQDYIERLSRLLSSTLTANPGISHPLFSAGKGRETAIAVFGSDKGLCGGFNSIIMASLESFLASHPDIAPRLFVTGRIAARRARRLGLEIVRSFSQPSPSEKSQFITDLTGLLSHLFLENRLQAAYIIYMRFSTMARQSPVVEKILPVVRENLMVPGRGRLAVITAGHGPASTFEPTPAAVLESILPQFLRHSVENAMINTIGSENAARHATMTRASQNAESMLRELTMVYSRLRQENITTQILELVAPGFAA